MVYAPAVAIELNAEDVRKETAALMAYRLKTGSFREGRGGAQQDDFTETTTPSLERARTITARNAEKVSDDFPAADESDDAELLTIAALLSAIELETSAPNYDADRVREWRLQLRESVAAVGGGDGGAPGPGEPGARVLQAVWGFGPTVPPRAEGAECAWVEPRRRLNW